jgi:hypothetical protein
MADKESLNQTTAKAAAASTQAYLNIAEIKDGVIVLKDGSMRAVLMTSALNFALKSGGEQDAIIFAYQRFLNSLTFPVQILVQSRRLDLDYYTEKLGKRAEEQDTELIKLQILEYVEFIKRLISVTNIMDKRFYVVVPFFPPGTEPVKGLGKMFSSKGAAQAEQKSKDEQFERGKVQLMQRVEQTASGLGGIGLRAVTLNTEELVELFYSIYNPSTATKQRLMDVDDLTAAQIHGPGVVDPGLAARPSAPVPEPEETMTSAPPTPASAAAPAVATPDDISGIAVPPPRTGETHGSVPVAVPVDPQTDVVPQSSTTEEPHG